MDSAINKPAAPMATPPIAMILIKDRNLDSLFDPLKYLPAMYQVNFIRRGSRFQVLGLMFSLTWYGYSIAGILKIDY